VKVANSLNFGILTRLRSRVLNLARLDLCCSCLWFVCGLGFGWGLGFGRGLGFGSKIRLFATGFGLKAKGCGLSMGCWA